MNWKRLAIDTINDIKKIDDTKRELNIKQELIDAEREFGSRIINGLKFVFMEDPEADWAGRTTVWAVPEFYPVVDDHINLRLISYRDKDAGTYRVIEGGAV